MIVCYYYFFGVCVGGVVVFEGDGCVDIGVVWFVDG